MVSRAEHKRATLIKLGNAALALFEEQGADATIEDIAKRAGISRRTVFRYVDAKEELAFVQPMLWFDVFESAINAHAGEPLKDRLLAASLAIADHIDADPDVVRRAFQLALQNPQLMRGYAPVFHRWINRVAEEVATELGASLDSSFNARVIGSATMGVIDAVTIEWVSNRSSRSFKSLLRQALKTLEPLWENLAR